MARDLGDAFVTISVNDDKLKASLAEDRIKVQELADELAKQRELHINDKALVATIDKDLLKIDRLSRKIQGLGSDVDTRGLLRLDAALATVQVSADRVKAKINDLGGRGTFLSWLTAGIPTLIKNLGNASTGFTGFISSLASSGPIGLGILAALAAAAATLATTLTTVLAALIPVTIGFGVFAALAIPTVLKVWKAVSAGGKAWRDLTPAQKAVGDQIKGLKTDFGKLALAIQPEVLKAFSEGLKIVKDLMPALRPLVIAAGKAIDAFLASMSNWLKSPSGKAFIKWLEVDGPKDIKTFGKIAWDTFTAIGVIFDHLYRAGVWLEGHLRTLFTIDIPVVWNIFRDKIKLVWFQMELDVEHFALSVTTTMGHLPGPLGAPFRKASADIRQSLAGIQQDVRNAEGQIQSDWDKLHGKNVSFGFKFQVPGSILGHATGISGNAAGAAGAAPGWSWVGERGPELINLRGGEQIIANHKIPGFAAGTLDPGFRDSFSPPVGTFLADFGRLFSVASNIAAAAGAAVLRNLAPAVSGGGHLTGAGPYGLGALENLWQQAGGPGGYIARIAGAIALAESGGSPNARNPSGASGLWQILGQVVAGNIFNPFTNALNAVSKFDSARGFSPWVTYETGAYRAYLDNGGWLPPGRSLVTNNTGRPERVLGPGEGQTVNVTLTVQTGRGASAMDRAIVDVIQKYVTVHGGDAQVALGQTGF